VIESLDDLVCFFSFSLYSFYYYYRFRCIPLGINFGGREGERDKRKDLAVSSTTAREREGERTTPTKTNLISFFVFPPFRGDKRPNMRVRTRQGELPTCKERGELERTKLENEMEG
jgi:hypothetical protein